jgi:hypothetical protein
MSYNDEFWEVKEKLVKLGPKAVQVLADRLEGKGRPGGREFDHELFMAREILDRLDIRRFHGPPPEKEG